MAKQFGVGDEAIRGLNDPERYPFPPDQKAALLFADAMTRGGGEVPDDLFDELRRHFSEPQIVEIACVVGTFNYFNRFNNAFRMDITLTDTEVVVRRVEQAIEGAPRDALDACERVVEILAQGRRYLRVGIYRRAEETFVRAAYRGPEAPRQSFRLGEGNAGGTGITKVVDDVSNDPLARAGLAATRSELVVPIRAGSAVLGVIDVESDREAAFGEEDRALVERVAAALVPVFRDDPLTP